MKNVIVKKTYVFDSLLSDKIIIEPGIDKDNIGIVIQRHDDTRRTYIDIDTWSAICDLQYEIRREAEKFIPIEEINND